MDQLFGLCNLFAIAGWLLMLVAPAWRWTERLVLSGAWSVLLSLVYVVLVLSFMPGAEGGFGSIAEVRALFASDPVLVAGWVHYLAFDLFVGACALRQARQIGIPHLMMIPILFAIFMLGPLGLALFFAAKSVRQKRAAAVIP